MHFQIMEETMEAEVVVDLDQVVDLVVEALVALESEL
jgi:hypothetical protein